MDLGSLGARIPRYILFEFRLMTAALGRTAVRVGQMSLSRPTFVVGPLNGAHSVIGGAVMSAGGFSFRGADMTNQRLVYRISAATPNHRLNSDSAEIQLVLCKRGRQAGGPVPSI